MDIGIGLAGGCGGNGGGVLPVSLALVYEERRWSSGNGFDGGGFIGGEDFGTCDGSGSVGGGILCGKVSCQGGMAAAAATSGTKPDAI